MIQSGKPPMPAGIEAIKAEMARRRFRSLAEAEAFLQRRMLEYNDTPQDELGGLSPNQMADLMSGDWETTGALRLHAPASDAVGGAAFVGNAQLLLRAAAAKGGLKATAGGNLSRAVVRDLVDRMCWPEYDREDFWHLNKVLNEEDVWPLHILRLVLAEAKLLRRRKGTFHATPRGRELAEDPAGGALLVTLFRAFFRGINLAYLSRVGPEERDPLQWRAAVVFLRLVAADDTWRSPDGWEGVLAYDRPTAPVIAGQVWSNFQPRWLRPLEWFGVLEGREVPGPYPRYPNREYRRAWLATTLLRFPEALVTAIRPP
jgi:hypothetical protein